MGGGGTKTDHPFFGGGGWKGKYSSCCGVMKSKLMHISATIADTKSWNIWLMIKIHLHVCGLPIPSIISSWGRYREKCSKNVTTIPSCVIVNNFFIVTGLCCDVPGESSS